MSAETVNQFLEDVGKDQQLAQELGEALKTENYKQAATDLAKNKGYQLTSEELWAELEKRQADFQKRQEAGELTDEELEAVAGGVTDLLSPNPVTMISGAIMSFIVSGMRK